MYPDKLIGLWGQTAGDVRVAMVEENDSAIMKQSPPWFIPEYQPSNRRIIWPNGATALIYYGDVPDQARGPDLMTVWVDELAKFVYPGKCWDNIEFCLRAEPDPRGIITSTPRPIKVIKNLFKDPNIVVTGGSLYENAANLSDKFINRIRRKYEGTDFGGQEIYGKVIHVAIEGRVYKRFNADIHVEEIDPHEIEGEVYLTCDFNVNPCVWELAKFDGETLYFFDEIAMRDVDTRTMSEETLRRLSELGYEGIIVAGDASGKARSTKGYQSDYNIMKKYGLGFRRIVPRSNPRIRDRLNAVNSALSQGKIVISPKCKFFITDLEEVCWKKGATGIIDSSNSDRTHASDAGGYLIYPLLGRPKLKKHSATTNR